MAHRYFHWDPVHDSVVQESDAGDNTLVDYTREPTSYGPLVSEHRDGQEYVHHYDALGSTTMLTDETGSVTDTFTYDAWGNEKSRTGTTDTPYRWVGRWGYQYDESTGSYYIRARTYQPTIARWISVDPFNKYLFYMYIYSYDNPTYFIDINGYQPTSPSSSPPITPWPYLEGSQHDPSNGITHVNYLIIKRVGGKLSRIINKDVGCGNKAFVEWNFELEFKAPCPGYFVQRVWVVCKFKTCDSVTEISESEPYYEAWEVKKDEVTTWMHKHTTTDEASYSPGVCDNGGTGTFGALKQFGEVRFYCESDAKNEIDSWHDPSVSGPAFYTSCKITPYQLKSTNKKPNFWDYPNPVPGIDPLAGPTDRLFEGEWNCCCNEKNFSEWRAVPY